MLANIPQPRITSLILLGALLVSAIAVWPMLLELAYLWDGIDPYTHGPLLFLVGVWCVWRLRDRIAAANWQPCWWFLVPLAGIAVLNLIPLTNLRLFMLPASVLSLVGLIAGPAVLRLVAFPVLLVHFALPGWGFCLPVLLHWTTAVVSVSLDVVNIPALIEAQYVTIPAGRFVIEEGCAGMKYFVAGGSLAVIFAYLYIDNWQRRLLMVAAGFAVSIVANWVRVFGIIVVGHVTNMQSGLVRDHEFFGWVIFGIALLPLFWLGARLSNDEDPPRSVLKTRGDRSGPGITIAAAAAGIAVLASAPFLARTVPPVAYEPVSMPGSIGQFTRAPRQSLFRPALTGATQRAHASYHSSGGPVRISIGLYSGGKHAELVNDFEHFEHMSNWRNVADRTIATGPGRNALRVRERELSHKRSGRRLSWHWYHVGGNPTSNRNVARLYLARSLLGGRRDAAQVILVADCKYDCENARAELETFFGVALPELNALLARAGGKEVIE